MKRAMLFAVMALVAQSASAQWYAGISGGFSRSDAAIADRWTVDTQGLTFSPVVGYELSPRVAVEASWFTVDQVASANRSTSLRHGRSLSQSTDYDAEGLKLALVGNMAISQTWSGYGSLGAYFMGGDYSSTSVLYDSSYRVLGSSAGKASGDSIVLGAALGLQWRHPASGWRLRMGYEYVDLNDSVFGVPGGPSNLGMMTVGVLAPIR